MAIHFIILTLPLGLSVFILSQREWIKLAFPALGVIQLAYLLFSRTRAGWLAFLIEIFCIVVFILWSKNRETIRLGLSHKKGIIYALLLFLCLMGFEQVSPFVGKNTFSSKINATMKQMQSPGKQVRIAYWLNTSAMIKDKPLLGVGLGNFEVHYPLYNQKVIKDPSFNVHVHVATPHNDYLQLIAETGLIGFAIALWACFRIGSILPWVFNRSEFSPRHLHATVLLTALIGIGVIACFSFPFQRTTPPLLTCIYIGLLTVLTKNTQKVQTLKKHIFAGVLMVGVSAIFIINYEKNKLLSEFNLTKAIGYYLAEDYANSVTHSLAAINHEPNNNENLYYLGLALLFNGQASKAINVLEKALDYKPNNITALSALGLAYGKIGEIDKATKKFEKSLYIFPENWLTYANMGEIYLENNLAHQAIDCFEKALKFHTTPTLWHKLGVSYRKYGDMINAEIAFEEKKRLLTLNNREGAFKE